MMIAGASETESNITRVGSGVRLAEGRAWPFPVVCLFVLIVGTAHVGGCATGSGSAESKETGRETESPSDESELVREGIVQVAVGGTHACALDESGRVYCWGDNRFGQLGSPVASNADRAMQVTSLPEVVQLTAGTAHTCALLEDGRVACWGFATEAETGSALSGRPDELARDPVPRLVRGPGADIPMNHQGGHSIQCMDEVLEGIVGVETAHRNTCAVHESDGVVCWGPDREGALGARRVWEGTKEKPLHCGFPVAGIRGAERVALSTTMQCASSGDGPTTCWGGRNIDSALKAVGASGDLEGGSYRGVSMAETPKLSGLRELSLGRNAACGIDEAGTVQCSTWSVPGTSGKARRDWSAIDGYEEARALSIIGTAGCVAGGDGSVRCVGPETLTEPIASSGAGQKGSQPADKSADTESDRTEMPPVDDIDVGGYARLSKMGVERTNEGAVACAVADSGEPYCWGDSSSPILRDGGLDGESGPGRVQLPRPSKPEPSLEPPRARRSPASSPMSLGSSSDENAAECPKQGTYGSDDAPNKMTVLLGDRSRTLHFEGGIAERGEDHWLIRFPTLQVGDQKVLERPLLSVSRSQQKMKDGLAEGETYSVTFATGAEPKPLDCMRVPYRRFGTLTVESPPSLRDGSAEGTFEGSFEIHAGSGALGGFEGSFSISEFRVEAEDPPIPSESRYRWKAVDEWKEWGNLRKLDVRYKRNKQKLRIALQTDTGTASMFGISGFTGEPGVYADNEHVYEIKTFGRDEFEMRKWRVPENKYVEGGMGGASSETKVPEKRTSFFEEFGFERGPGSEQEEKGPRDDISIPPPEGKLAGVIKSNYVAIEGWPEPVTLEQKAAPEAEQDEGEPPSFDADSASPSDTIFSQAGPDGSAATFSTPNLRRRIVRRVADPDGFDAPVWRIGPPAPLDPSAVPEPDDRWESHPKAERLKRTVDVRVDSLLPARRSYWFRAAYGRKKVVPTDVEILYRGDEVQVTAENDVQGRHQKTFPADKPVLDRHQIPWSLAYLPLEEGYRTSFQIFELERSTSTVRSDQFEGGSVTNLQLTGSFHDAELRVTETREITRGPLDAEGFIVDVEIGDGRTERYLLRKSFPHHVLAELHDDGEVFEYRYLSTTPDSE